MSTDTTSPASVSRDDLDEDELKEAIQQGVLDAYLVHGYSKTTDEGEVADKAALHEAIYAAVKTAIVKDARTKSETALTHGAVAKKVFPSTPGASDEWDELDAVQRGVWEQVVKDAWNPTNPNFSGPVQRLVGERDDELVLIRTKTTVGGKPAVDVVYVTALEELIFSDFMAPLTSSVRRASERLAKNAALVAVRNAELSQRAGREVDSGMKAAGALAKSTLQLMSGTNES